MLQGNCSQRCVHIYVDSVYMSCLEQLQSMSRHGQEEQERRVGILGQQDPQPGHNGGGVTWHSCTLALRTLRLCGDERRVNNDVQLWAALH